jgi:hypothetical protein
MVNLLMPGDEAARRHGNYGIDSGPDHEGVTACFTSNDTKQCPGEVKTILDACHSLRADALVLETIDHATVTVMNIYDGTFAAALCDPYAHLPSIIRGLQVRLYSGPCDESSAASMPAATARSALGRWERQIALVFGRQYAAILVTGAAGDKAPGEMSAEGLEQIRLRLVSAIGGCILLEKVDK